MIPAARLEQDLVVAADHPSFAGHFPGHPILPGVVLLAEALAAIEAATARPAQEWILSQAKFLGFVAPGTALTLACETLATGAIRFEIRSGREIVATGLVSPRESGMRPA